MAKDNLSNALSKRIGEQKHEPHSIDRDYDEMYGLNYSKANEIIVELDVALLKPHPKDPFKPYSEDKLKELSDRIANIGLLDPIHVRPDGNGQYEILAGKNRTNATKLSGGKKIKAVIREVDDETAIMIITDSNLKHRDKLLPSEKGFAYRLQLETINKQGKRNDLMEDLTSVENQQKLSRKIVAEFNHVKDNEIQRYIRLTYLHSAMLEMIDNNKMPIMSGVCLSYLDEQSQLNIVDYLFVKASNKKISIKIAEALRKKYSDKKNTLSEQEIKEIINATSLGWLPSFTMETCNSAIVKAQITRIPSLADESNFISKPSIVGRSDESMETSILQNLTKKP